MNSRNMLYFFLSFNLVVLPVCARDLKIVEAQEALMKQDFDGFFKKVDELEKNEENAKEIVRILDEVMRECVYDKLWKNIQRAVCASFIVLGASHFIPIYRIVQTRITKLDFFVDLHAWHCFLIFELYQNPQSLGLATSYFAAGLVGWHKAGKDEKLIDLFRQKLSAIKERVVGDRKKLLHRPRPM